MKNGKAGKFARGWAWSFTLALLLSWAGPAHSRTKLSKPFPGCLDLIKSSAHSLPQSFFSQFNREKKLWDLSHLIDPIEGVVSETGAGLEITKTLEKSSGRNPLLLFSVSTYHRLATDERYGSVSNLGRGENEYISKIRLFNQLQSEYQELHGLGGTKRKFVVAATSATARNDGVSWIGVMAQVSRAEPPQTFMIRFRLKHERAALQKEEIGLLGLNLLHALYARSPNDPLRTSLLDGISDGAVVIDRWTATPSQELPAKELRTLTENTPTQVSRQAEDDIIPQIDRRVVNAVSSTPPTGGVTNFALDINAHYRLKGVFSEWNQGSSAGRTFLDQPYGGTVYEAFTSSSRSQFENRFPELRGTWERLLTGSEINTILSRDWRRLPDSQVTKKFVFFSKAIDGPSPEVQIAIRLEVENGKKVELRMRVPSSADMRSEISRNRIGDFASKALWGMKLYRNRAELWAFLRTVQTADFAKIDFIGEVF